MKKNIIFILMFLIMPMSVHADSVSLDCPKEVDSGSTFTCNVVGNSEIDVTSLSALVELGDGLELVGFIPADGWQGDGLDGNIGLYGADDMHGDFKIGVLKLKSNKDDNNIIFVNSIFFNNIDGKKNAVNSVSKTINILEKNADDADSVNTGNDSNITNDDISDDNSGNDNIQSDEEGTNDNEVINSVYLVDVQIEGYELNFNKEVFEYILKIEHEESLKITPFLEDNSSTCIINGNENLEDGSVITLEVLGRNNEVQKYMITIDKDDLMLEEKKYYNLIFIIVIVILVIINVVRLVMSRRKKNEE